MNALSRTITGGVMILFGIILSLIPFFVSDEGIFSVLFFSIPILILGVFILLNREEDEIEERKDFINTKKLKKRR